jgi:thiopurine S-methyltransferase
MHQEFWQERWRQGETGWHLPGVNALLERYWSRLAVEPPAAVFVPLCGKSRDLDWLAARGHSVIGCELSRLAVESWFADNALHPEVTEVGPFLRYRAGAVEIWCGDYFRLEADQLADAEAVYDRAALVALPPDLRERYTAHLRQLFPRPVPMFLIAFDYPQHEMEGPPFAVSADEVTEHFDSTHRIETVAVVDALADNPRFRERGLTSLRELAITLFPRRAPGGL